MNKKLLFLGFGISLFALAGCGQLNKLDPNPGDTDLSPLNSAKHVNIIATSKIKITLGDKKSGVSAQSIETSLIASQSVEIEADVPSFMTFEANSSIFFNVTQLGLINADGTITLNVVYNDLISQDLQGVRVRAYMVEANGLHGQQVSGNIIPLDIQVVNGIPYQPLTTSSANMKVWNAPFMQAINEQVVLKLRGNFTYALKQQYKGTIMLEFVRDENIDSLPPGMPTNFTASAGDQRVTLNWTNPADTDLKEVEVRVATTNYPISVTDGTLVYKGINQSYIHTGLANGTTYYYNIFARDVNGNVSSANRTSATPQSSPDPYTKLLLHMDGNWTDSSLSNHFITAGAGSTFTTDNTFGTHAASINSSAGYLSVLGNISDFQFGSGSFTIDFRVKINSIPSNGQGIWGIADGVDSKICLRIDTGGTLRFFDYDGGNFRLNISSPQTVSTGCWHHIALVRNSDLWTFYIDGIATGSSTASVDLTPYSSFSFIGNNLAGYEFAGLLDEFRISKGIARWTSNFTPPTAPY